MCERDVDRERACVCLFVCVCVCICEGEGERDRDRDTEREREKERERERGRERKESANEVDSLKEVAIIATSIPLALTYSRDDSLRSKVKGFCVNCPLFLMSECNKGPNNKVLQKSPSSLACLCAMPSTGIHPSRVNPDEAIDHWNRRPAKLEMPPSPPVEVVSAARRRWMAWGLLACMAALLIPPSFFSSSSSPPPPLLLFLFFFPQAEGERKKLSPQSSKRSSPFDLGHELVLP